MKPSPDSIQKAHFDASASNYDQSHDGDEHTIAADLVLEFAQVQGYGALLDVGCGTGRVLKQMRRANKRMQLYGIEPNEALIRAGRSKILVEDRAGRAQRHRVGAGLKVSLNGVKQTRQ